MQRKPQNGALAGSLLLAVILFGANNTGVKYLVGYWPPLTVGATRFLLAGPVLMALIKWTRLFGTAHPLTAGLKRRLWWRTGLNMAAYIVVFNTALKLTSISHVALYLGAAPVWALLWEGQPEKHWRSVHRYGAAALAFSGVFILFWPVLRQNSAKLPGELLGLAASVLWTSVGRQSRLLGTELSGAQIAGHTFWRAGVLLIPLALIELLTVHNIPWRADLVWTQIFCALGGGVVPFSLWNIALRHWKTSQVYLFNNMIPISTMTWAHFCLGEPFTRTFWMAMLLIGTGVLLGQANLERFFGPRWQPSE